MDDFTLSIKSNLDEFARDLDNMVLKQMPYAASLTINKLAKLVAAGEVEGITETFPTATPFTKKGMGVIPSNKNRLEAVVFLKDIQAHYLEPYEFGGKQVTAKPGNVAILAPKKITLNQYGNIPYQKIKNLKDKSNVFSKGKYQGGIKLKDGTIIRGVFQRLKGRKGGPRLKILVRFSDPLEVKKHMDYFNRATKIVERNFDKVMDESMDIAMASAK